MTMNEPQVWTLIGVFGAALLGGFTLVATHFGRVVRAEIGRLEGTLTGKIEALDGKLSGQIETLDARLNGRIDILDHRLDTLDKEVANLATKVWRSS
ncbi:hypothetical protein [Microbacterium sp. Leaf320]|uniref:hypothetical protein n=1 Tax=Microbacterium sp. Leaf320 TaxID=1736334 RepID=UPI00070090DD|nr:hypothetical protein [Microbacterium sp. Leaf320]KQQ67276.1 hypothetical protein ASF63_08740 [Microbacterium sp. Leaf320]